MSSIQNQDWETNLYLSLSGSPVPGILFSDVTIQYKKFGDSALTARTLLEEEWVDLGNGFYTLLWPASYINRIGKFFYTMTGSLFDNFLYDEFDIESPPLESFVAADTCVISGNLRDLGGVAGKGQTVAARLINYPASSGPSIVTSDLVQTIPDYFGNFQIALLRGKTVLISIQRTAIHHQITVPDESTANLIDLLPPLPG